MKNTDTEQLRQDAEALRLAAFNALSEDHRRALSGQGRELLLLFHAARIVSGMADAQPESVDRVIDQARAELKCSEKGYARLSQMKRDAIRCAVAIMITDHQPLPPSTGRSASFEGQAISKDEAIEGRIYEVLVGTGARGWHDARKSGRKWSYPDGAFLAYPSAVTAVRIPGEVIREQVTRVLKYFAATVPELGEEATHAECRDRIRRVSDRIIYDRPLAVDAERSDSWWRVRDAIHGGFLRFYIHVDVGDGPDLPAAA